MTVRHHIRTWPMRASFIAVLSTAFSGAVTAACATHDLLVGDDSPSGIATDASDDGEGPFESGESPDGTASSKAEAEAAAPSCSKAAYDSALVYFQAAVTAAKARLQGASCDEVNGIDATLFGIGAEAHAAVEACKDFRDVIRNSADAAAIRATFDGNLALASFDGRLELADSQGNLVMTGLAQVLAGGITLWGPAPGSYGNVSKIEFGPGNQAVLSRLDIDTLPYVWRDETVSYAIGNTTADGVEITITKDGTPTTYLLAPGSSEPFDFFMSPQTPSNEEFFSAIPSECEA